MTGEAETVNQSDPRHIWFVDTASLLSMAVDPDIRAVVIDEIGTDLVVIVDVVRDELNYRSDRSSTAALARAALRDLPERWTDLDSSKYVNADDVGSVQDDVADGRPLLADGEHLAESTIIALAMQSARSSSGYPSIKVLLSEDWDARRVAAGVPKPDGGVHPRPASRPCARPPDVGVRGLRSGAETSQGKPWPRSDRA